MGLAGPLLLEKEEEVGGSGRDEGGTVATSSECLTGGTDAFGVELSPGVTDPSARGDLAEGGDTDEGLVEGAGLHVPGAFVRVQISL
jgi:hypothetical protein